MINARELMLGNKVVAKNGQMLTVSIIQCVPIGKQNMFGEEYTIIDFRENKTGHLITSSREDNIDPIVLTVQIIEKLGFKIERVYSENVNGLHRRTNGILAFDYIDNSFIVIYNDKKNKHIITSLHQFQNWYFILTGQELVVDL